MTVHERGRKPALTAVADALTKAPPVPGYLSDFAKAEWRRVMPDLIAKRILTKGDLGGVEEYCIMRGVIREIEAERKSSGGAIDPRSFGIQNRAAATARQLASEFGLTPTSRQRMGVAGDDDAGTDNPLLIK